ncbi:hypothetical protein M436DRAFT_39489 [Aureobasidium namibiae CBS 147.97]|uniref:Autophagy-related protein 2 n=1 Tax=Aureobasidium namibiae CBS 147.97 TaxID=1043004 RepID=A0A074WRU6_9PEZI|nr:uncharacterized protein M436DRAFT_39489 [Aureobasidium namibiae CBS 147.97]KEQ75910.1 hypothetical protein M436DRAFT_39489 [Aureobasidium namibiae CBS 147.97]
MASWMPAYFQKRLLRTALSRIALLDVDSLDLDSLGVNIGRTSTVELKHVGLRVQELSALLQLPPNIRLHVARVLSLRLTVPANFFQQSIIAEVDGIEVHIAADVPAEHHDDADDAKAPEHRKTNRRIQSPAASFQESSQPVEEKLDLEARYMAKSSLSDTSDDLGTGISLGLPAMVASFLQGIVDRVQVRIKDVNIRLSLHESTPGPSPIIFIANLANIQVNAAAPYAADTDTDPQVSAGKRRHIALEGLSVHYVREERFAHTRTSMADLFASYTSSATSRKEEHKGDTLSKPEPALAESGVLPHMNFPAYAHLSDSDSESLPDEMTQSTASFDIRNGPDLTESVVYSHAEAESMYLSAVGPGPAQGTRTSPNLRALPGGWNSVIDDDEDLDLPFLSQHLNQQSDSNFEDRALTPTLRNQSPVHERQPEVESQGVSLAYISKELLVMHRLNIGIRQAPRASRPAHKAEDSISQSSMTTSAFQQTPGAFSIYAEGGRSSVRFNAPATDEAARVSEDSEAMDTTIEIEATPIKLQLDADVEISNHPPPAEVGLKIGNLIFTAGSNIIFSFDTTKQQSEKRSAQNAITVTSVTRTTIQGQSVRRIEADLLPLHVDLDLVKFDEDFETLGGMIGIVEMSSSLLSSEYFAKKQEVSAPPRRGVRFREPLPDVSAEPEIKFGARLEGFDIKLASKSCSLELQASTTKVIHRQAGVKVTIEALSLTMPTTNTLTRRSNLDISVRMVQVVYKPTPLQQDLSHLISLVTPSKNKYENDDDILVDTLIRQRRKGSVLNVHVSSFQTYVHEWDFVPHLQLLGGELSKLSAVTKYLPEDDTPGVLFLIKLADSQIRVPINEQFGLMNVSLKNIQVAHVGLPALTALSTGDVRLGPVGGHHIIHEMLSGACTEEYPMLMLRMVGDEVEPVVKVKLFNICVEYDVPTLLSLTSTQTALEVEQKAQDLAASLLENPNPGPKKTSPPVSDVSKSSGIVNKKLAIDVLLHGCALGLQPTELRSKGLLLLEDTKFGTSVPPDESFEAVLNIRQATLYVADHEAVLSPDSLISPTSSSQPNHSLRLQNNLLDRGYVSVSSIRSAQATVCVLEDDLNHDKFVDVELRDEFFLLETCADSTQTLISVLNGLSPPAIANDDPKFRPQPHHGLMTLDDMVNSFSGDAFVKPGHAPSALFDAEMDLPLAEEDSLMVGSDITSGLYEAMHADMGLDDEDFYSGAHEQQKRFPVQVRVRDVNIIWNLYDGYDWRRTREAITQAVEEVEMKLEERKSSRRRSNTLEDDTETVIGDCLFNSIYIGVPSAREPADLRHSISNLINQGNEAASETESYATTGISRPSQADLSRQKRLRKKRLRLQRGASHKLGFELKGVSLDFLIHPAGSSEVQSSIDVRVTNFEIYDHVPTSTWKKFLTLHNDKKNMREMMKPMIHLELLNVRPVPELVATEMTLRVSVLPLRLHVDQDALEFMTRFFDFKDDSSKPADIAVEPPFIQRLEVNTVSLCLDYKPKKVDYVGLRGGRMSEFKNFVTLEKADIKLKHAIIYGLRGFDTLHDTLSDIWTPDVIHNQLRGVLAGIGMTRPLVELGIGIRDIVAVPVAEIRKDGFKVRSVQKGAVKALSTTSSGFARLIAKVAIGTGTRLQDIEDMLSPAQRSVSNQASSNVEEEYEQPLPRAVSNYADQPLGVLQGLHSARRYLERDLTTAKDAIIAVQGDFMASGTAAGAAKAVMRHAPTILLQPVIGVSRAVGQTFKGVGNQVDREHVKKSEDVSPFSFPYLFSLEPLFFVTRLVCVGFCAIAKLFF